MTSDKVCCYSCVLEQRKAVQEAASVYMLGLDKHPEKLKEKLRKFGSQIQNKMTNAALILEQRGEARGIQLGEQRGEARGIQLGERRGEERGIRIGEQRGIQMGEERGIQIGEQRGEEKGRIETARRLLSMNIPMRTIAQATDLSEEAIGQLKPV